MSIVSEERDEETAGRDLLQVFEDNILDGIHQLEKANRKTLRTMG